MNLLLVDYLSDRVMFFIERFGHHQLDISETSDGAIQRLQNQLYNIIFLGGELGGGGHGSDVAEWIAEHPENENYDAAIFIHTWNTIEVEVSMKALPHANFIPFDETIYSTLDI